jgi:hypothetical protein
VAAESEDPVTLPVDARILVTVLPRAQLAVDAAADTSCVRPADGLADIIAGFLTER